MADHHSAIEVPPTRERFAKGGVAIVSDPIVVTDSDGHAVGRSLPFRGADILDRLYASESIDEHAYLAGMRFRSTFRRAQLDSLMASDLTRPFIQNRQPRAAISGDVEHARDSVDRAIRAVGGHASDPGSCLWHVVGWEHTLKEWASRGAWRGSMRPMNPHEARGILRGALAALAIHYER